MQKRFEPITERTAEILDFIMAAPEIPDDDGLKFRIRLCSEEAVVNVVNYAYEGGLGFLEVNTDSEDGWFSISLKDGGTPFDPLASPDPDISLAADQRQIGGLGIFLCKQMMDEVSYIWENGCNVLNMKIKTQ